MNPNIKDWLSSNTLKEGIILMKCGEFQSGTCYRVVAFSSSSLTLEEATSKPEKETLILTENDQDMWCQITNMSDEEYQVYKKELAERGGHDPHAT